jgi:hypothetical protein
MTQEAYCPQHGPYDASLGGCPYCSGSQRPAAPTPLEDDLPTDLGLDPLSPSSPGMGGGEGELSTEIPARRAGRGFLDIDGEEETELGRRVEREDVTELEFDTARTTEGMLWVKEGPRRGRFYPIMHGTVIGRKDGDLILDDPKVSGMHAKFTLEGGGFVVWDFGSANGTYVNGKKIREATRCSSSNCSNPNPGAGPRAGRKKPRRRAPKRGRPARVKRRAARNAPSDTAPVCRHFLGGDCFPFGSRSVPAKCPAGR